MPDWFTDEEMERIVRFAESTKFDRDPAMLLPDDDTDAEPQETTRHRDGGGGRHGRGRGPTVPEE